MSDEPTPVLTAMSTVQCGHGGSVLLGKGAARLLVLGKPVLLKRDVEGRDIGQDCGTKPSATTAPCTKVLSVTQGLSTKLRVDGEGVLLEDLQGTTTGAPMGLLAASSGQSKLKAK